MWLKLNLDGIIASIQIKGYKQSGDYDCDDTWCKTDFSFVSDPWLNYGKIDDEVLLATEVEELRDLLEKLLCDRVKKKIRFKCIEPDFIFNLKPKTDIREDPNIVYVNPEYAIADIDVEWEIYFWDSGGLTCNYLSIFLDRDDIESLCAYLQLVTGKIKEDDPIIAEMIKKNILY